MKPKIVYCLVSDVEDYYYEQLLISLCSLRKHNPEAKVEVVCDEKTFATLQDNRSTIFDFNVQVITVETPQDWEKWERSRYIKTNLRRLVQDDYLYIDTDTVICSSLDLIDNLSYDVSAVFDSHLERPLPRYSRCQHKSDYWIWDNAKKANIDIAGLWHYNSGVMYVKDTMIAHELYARWYDKYKEQLKYGVNIDQLPLLLANHDMKDIISPLHPKLNCQVAQIEGRNLLPESIIIHYFPCQKTTLLSSPWIMDSIKESGRINDSIQHIIDDPFSFFEKESFVAMGAAAELIKTPSLLTAYIYSQKVFSIFAFLIDAYVRTKRSIHKLISSSQ